MITRKFRGVKYGFYNTYYSKSHAQKVATRIRRGGGCARVVPGLHGTWDVWYTE